MILPLIQALSTHLSLISLPVASHHLRPRVHCRSKSTRQHTLLSTTQQAVRTAAHAMSCSPAEITHAQLCANRSVRWPYVTLTSPPCPINRHRLRDLITHPSSQHAFVADLAAGGISPPEFSLYTAGARVQGIHVARCCRHAIRSAAHAVSCSPAQITQHSFVPTDQ